jgi:hypothetical protein
MRQSLDPYELSLRILCELEEAHWETLSTLVVTLVDVDHGDAGRHIFRKAIELLLKSGDVTLTRPRLPGTPHLDHGREEVFTAVRAAMNNLLHEMKEPGRPTCRDVERESMPPLSEGTGVGLTQQGLARVDRLLDERGYRWWVDAKSNREPWRW